MFPKSQNSKNTRTRKGKILTFVPTGLTSAGESRSRFRLELNEELEGSIFSSNALMSTSAVLRAGGLVVGNIPMGASGSERGSKMALSEGAKTFAGSGRIRRRTSGKY